MRHAPVTAALTLLLGCAATALTAQGPVPDAPAIAPPAPPVVTPQRKLNLTIEQRYIIRENIKDVNREPVSAPAPAVGDPVAHNTRLQPMPDAVAQKVPQVKAHKFFVANGEIVIVDPKDNTVAERIRLEN